MNKQKTIVIFLIAVLSVSVAVNAYQTFQAGEVAKQANADAARLEMAAKLCEAQVAVNVEIKRMGDSVLYASRQLSGTGLSGDGARSVLSALAANSSFIVDAATLDLNGVFRAVAPANYSSFEGTQVTIDYSEFATSQAAAKPTLTNVIPLVEGFNGACIQAPVFNNAGAMIGSVSVIFDPNVLIRTTVEPLVAGTAFTMWAMQPDSLEIYDADQAQVGLRIFSDELFEPYADAPVALYIANEASGYGTYPFIDTVASGRHVTKECFWNTIGGYGTDWRLVIAHIIEA